MPIGGPGESAAGAFSQSTSTIRAAMTLRRIAFLGAGNMGRALIGGLLRSGTRPEQLSVGESQPAAREVLAREFGVTAVPDNRAAIAGASIVVLAVKPQDVAAVLAAARRLRSARRARCSSRWRPECASRRSSAGAARSPVVRAMPNRPALVGAGATGLYAPAGGRRASSARRPSGCCRRSARWSGCPPRSCSMW